MNYPQAAKQAHEIIEALRPFCKRIEVAGSIRRKKQDDIKDVEIVLIPDNSKIFQLAEVVNSKWGKPSIGKWPAKYTKIRCVYCIDIFTADAANWGLLYFIRTGPADYARKALADWKRISHGGFSEGAVLHYGDMGNEPTPEESDVFKALQRPWVEPENRF